MSEPTTRHCAHLACSCEVEGDERYCGSDCEQAVQCSPAAGQPPRCGCGHPECGGWERVTEAS